MFDFSYSLSSPNNEITESFGWACLLFYIYIYIFTKHESCGHKAFHSSGVLHH